MPYTKKKSETVEDNITATEQADSVADTLPDTVFYQAKKAIPLDALVYVKNLTGGKLIYKDPRTGYTYIWEKYGEEVPIEMRELINMKNTASKFFTENWIQVDMVVLRDLHMENYYKDFISYEDIESLLNNSADDIIGKLKNASMVIKNSVGLRAIHLIEEKKLTDINVIRALEEALNCKLIENI